MIILPYCLHCEHYNEKDGNCSAFPEKIPNDILTSHFLHTQKHPDQVGDYLYKGENPPTRTYDELDKETFLID